MPRPRCLEEILAMSRPVGDLDAIHFRDAMKISYCIRGRDEIIHADLAVFESNDALTVRGLFFGYWIQWLAPILLLKGL